MVGSPALMIPAVGESHGAAGSFRLEQDARPGIRGASLLDIVLEEEGRHRYCGQHDLPDRRN